MGNGYLGKLLLVDLSTSKMTTKELPKNLLREFIGGYRLGARLLLERMSPATDPLGSDNYMGFFTGDSHQAMGWDVKTGKPSSERLEDMDLGDWNA